MVPLPNHPVPSLFTGNLLIPFSISTLSSSTLFNLLSPTPSLETPETSNVPSTLFTFGMLRPMPSLIVRSKCYLDSFYAVECGGGLPNWNSHPYDCTDQYDHTKCFYCSGRANGFEAKNVCLNRNGRECNELFSSPEAKAYCNIAFECPASTLSQPFFLLAILSVLLAVKNFC